MKNQDFWHLFHVIAVFSILLAGCSPQANGNIPLQATEWGNQMNVSNVPRDDLYIMVSALGEVEYFKDHQLGMKKAGEALGVETDYVGPDDLDLNAMRTSFQEAIAREPAGIIVIGFDKGLNSLVEEAYQRHIPVVTVDSDLPGSKRIAFVGTGNFQAGYEGGVRLAKLIGGQGKVALVTKKGQPNLDERVYGYLEALRKNPLIQVVEVIDNQANASLVEKQVAELIRKYPDLAGIGCVEAVAGAGVAQEVVRLNRSGEIKIMAMDKDQKVLSFIESGVISGTVVQQTALMPFYAVQILYALNHGNQEINNTQTPMMIDTGVIILDKHNYKEILN
ncbi:substrate-binding domain-containing protein [Ammoniphilus resinae]|uniref:Ribose transport system substrate-binding protein n=1 Tax=Ammoniphilus resinae TaxID=861532 RepID=A0ABS4GVL7_9BACL|nr:substrate-binding domain-containing protein [Ammoniphilus resinae]MBP1934304.1 ribose transport system substrate-binding protein [Ammoniphilus resinae]